MSYLQDEAGVVVDAFDRAVAAQVLAMGWPATAAPALRELAARLLEAVHALWRQGHAALPLEPAALEAAGLAPFAALVADPALPQLLGVLIEARLVADGREADSPAPFVYDSGEGGAARQLYPARTYWAERAIAERLQALLERPAVAVSDAGDFGRELLGATPADDQARALASALAHGVTVVAGGPGSGKTWLAARILAALAWARQRAGEGPPTVLAVAPTGKAAARFQESLQAALLDPAGEGIAAVLGDDAAAILGSLGAVKVQTIHRAVGWGRRPPLHRIDADIVLIDEGSMVDLEVMAALLNAIPEDARLIVLGDSAQLASVAAGTVFADLVAAGAPDALLAGCVTSLTRSRRFPAASDLAAVAAATQELAAGLGDAEAVVERLAAAERDVRWIRADLSRDDEPSILERLAAHYRKLDAEEVRQACRSGDRAAANMLSSLIGAARVLTPFREGPWGVAQLNEALGRRVGGAWSPLLVTRNDYAVGLMNGDLGIRFGDTVWFVDGDGVRPVSAALLPPHEPAWAMTIHKSQGSEYDYVAVLLPPREGRGRALVTRELLFTGLTRARLTAGSRDVHLELYAAESELRAALARRAVRFGGLRARLGAGT